MKTLISIILVLFFLYILMLGWNSVMYRQFPFIVIHNYWLFVASVVGIYYLLKLAKGI